jgi:hypothetical protein
MTAFGLRSNVGKLLSRNSSFLQCNFPATTIILLTSNLTMSGVYILVPIPISVGLGQLQCLVGHMATK